MQSAILLPVWSATSPAFGGKIGQLKIRELRTQAARELGDKFDVRAFHDQLLGNGSLPLGQRIEDWLFRQKTAK